MAHGHRRDTGVLGKVLARIRDRVLNRLRVRHADLPAVAVVPVPSSLSLAALESFPQLGVLWMGPTQQALGPAVRYSEKRKPLRVLLVILPAEDRLEFVAPERSATLRSSSEIPSGFVKVIHAQVGAAEVMRLVFLAEFVINPNCRHGGHNLAVDGVGEKPSHAGKLHQELFNRPA